MTWQKKKKIQGKNQHYSICNKLRREGKTTEEFEVMLASLSLEEAIAIKLELATRAAGGLLYGLPLWNSLPTITKDAILKYTYSATRTQKEAMHFLGLSKSDFKKLINKYRIESYFKEEEQA